MFRTVNLLLVLVLFSAQICASPQPTLAQTQKRVVSNSFSIPPSLEGRVDFWVRIFTQYGKHQVLVHHRDFPQAIFGSIDFERHATRLSENKLNAYKSRVKNEHIKAIHTAAKRLATGAQPQSALEQQVYNSMKLVPGGLEKYRKLYTEDLVRTQTGIKERFAEAVARAGRYLYVIEEIFVGEFGLPKELTLLPYVESSFDYRAYSSVGAAGIWQFMPRTARGFGMRVDGVVDERRDIISATRSAAKYLQQAYSELGNWPLALTSYNHGVAGVKGKVKKIGLRDLAAIVEHPTERVFGFASSNFYPEFLAALKVHYNYRSYFPGLEVEGPRHVTTYKLPHAMSVSHVSKTLGISAQKLEEYNYALSSRVWKGVYSIPKNYVLKLPANHPTNLASLRVPEPVGPTASSIYGGASYRVRAGDTLSKIARKYGTSVGELRNINGLRSDTVVVGQLLRVKKSEAEPAIVKSVPIKPVEHAPHISNSTSTVTKSNGASSTYKIGAGDTLYSISKKSGVPIREIKEINNIKGNTIKLGQTLKLPTIGSLSVKKSASGIQSGMGKTYTVQSGDTLWSIASRYNCSVTALRQSNNIKGNKLRVGQKVKVP